MNENQPNFWSTPEVVGGKQWFAIHSNRQNGAVIAYALEEDAGDAIVEALNTFIQALRETFDDAQAKRKGGES